MKNLWTKRNIMDYLSHPEESLDKNYTPIRQKYIRELRRMDEETKRDGGLELYFERFNIKIFNFSPSL